MTKSVTPLGNGREQDQLGNMTKVSYNNNRLEDIYLLLKHILPILEQYQAILFRFMVYPLW